MTCLTLRNMGLALRSVVYELYPTARAAADALDIDENDLRRAWVQSSNGNHASFDRMLSTLSKLGYEVHFQVKRRGDDDGQQSRSCAPDAALSQPQDRVGARGQDDPATCVGVR